MYACQYEALTLLIKFSLFMTLYFINNYEWDALNNWSPFGVWSPSEVNPRCGYHNVILGSEYSIGFNIFSMTYPLRFRE